MAGGRRTASQSVDLPSHPGFTPNRPLASLSRVSALCSKAARCIAASAGRLCHLPLSPIQRPTSAVSLVGTSDNANIEWRVGREQPLTDPAIIILA